jgi:hypothetical protein
VSPHTQRVLLSYMCVCEVSCGIERYEEFVVYSGEDMSQSDIRYVYGKIFGLSNCWNRLILWVF